MSPVSDETERLDDVVSEISARLRRGEAPELDAYCAAHPDLADELREIVPVLGLVEGLKVRGRGPTTSTSRPRGGKTPRAIGPYAVSRELGRGGMGVVYEARGPGPGGTDTEVALKVVHPHLLPEAEYVARFLREADAGCRVRHPGVVGILGTGLAETDAGELPYLVLELVEGRNLRQLVRDVGPLPERLCRHVAVHLAEALTAVHAAGLVHRDVKPENVMVTPDETVKLMDLGVAVLQDRGDRISRTGAFVGSVLYAAPEQLAGGDVSPSWDLYALGLLLAEIATGRHVDPRGDGAMAPGLGLSPFFRRVVATLLASEAERRFPSARALARVLRDGERSAWWRERREAAQGVDLLRREEAVPFVGRGAERLALDEAWERARTGEGGSLLITGEAGMGKTRLVGEWLRERMRDGVAHRRLVLAHGPGACAAAGDEIARALAELLGPGPLRPRVEGLLGGDSLRAAAVLRRLDDRDGATDTEKRIFAAAFTDLVRALAGEQPLVLLVEDLHFADEETRAWFLAAATALGDARVLVVGTSRPGLDPAWLAELQRTPRHASVALEGLDEGATAELVQALRTRASHRVDSLRDLRRRSDGNPYFLLELLRDQRARSRASGRGTTSVTTVPDSLQGLLRARLARLPGEDRELLQAAACAGFEFDPEVIAEASGAGPFTTLTRLARLEREAQLLRSFGQKMRFHHHLLQEVLYAEMLPALRRAWHGALGLALEGRGRGHDGEGAVELATHFLEAGQVDRAVPYLLDAFAWLTGEAHAHDRVILLADRALRHESGLPPATLARALIGRGEHHSSGRRIEKAIEDFTRASMLAEKAQAGAARISAELQLAEALATSGRSEDSLAHFRAARDAASAVGQTCDFALAMGRHGMELSNLGRPDEGIREVHEALDVLLETPNAFYEGRVRAFAAEIEIKRGNVDEAERQLAAARRAVVAAGDLSSELVIEGTRGRLAFRQGRFRDASRHVDRYADLGRQIGYTRGIGNYLANQALCLYELGDLETAKTRAEEALEFSQREGTHLAIGTSHLSLAQVALARGELTGALAQAKRTLDMRRAASDLDAILSAEVLYAAILALLGRGSAARRAIERSRADWGAEAPERALLHIAAMRGVLADAEGRTVEAVADWNEVSRLSARLGRVPARSALPLGTALVRAGRIEEARPLLETAARWGRKRECVRYAVLAEAFLASVELGDGIAARLALEQHEAGLPVRDRIEAHLRLSLLPDGRTNLERARHWLQVFVASAPALDRDTMRMRLDLHRQVTESST